MLPDRRSLFRELQSVGLRALILMLCFAAWRGPLPWIHEHHTEQPGSDVDGSFTRHLVHYHAGHNPAYLLWHVHFIVFWDGLPDEESDNKSPHAQDPLLTSAVSDTGASLASDWADRAVVVDMLTDAGSQGVAVPGIVATDKRADSFLASLLSTAPLRAVTGVALC